MVETKKEERDNKQKFDLLRVNDKFFVNEVILRSTGEAVMVEKISKPHVAVMKCWNGLDNNITFEKILEFIEEESEKKSSLKGKYNGVLLGVGQACFIKAENYIPYNLVLYQKKK